MVHGALSTDNKASLLSVHVRINFVPIVNRREGLVIGIFTDNETPVYCGCAYIITQD